MYGLGIATDGAGYAYVIGATNASNIITKNAFQSTCGACKLGFNSGTQHNAFIMKVNTNASGDSSLLYSTYFGGNVSDAGYGIAVDAFGNVYVAGQASSSNFPTTTGVMQPIEGGGLYYSGGDAFIAKFDLSQSGASSLIWSTYLGGTGDEGASALAIDSASNVFVTGWNNNGGFPTLNAPQSTFAGGVTNPQTGEIPVDAFVAKVKSDGTTLLYATYLGGSGNDQGNGIAVDSAGNAYVAGVTRSPNFPTVAGYLDTLRGVSDGFVGKLHLVPDFTIGDLDPITIEVGGTGSTQVDIKSADEFNSLVKFLVAGLPSGLVPSFNPDSVTPPVNGTASATMTVVAGPSVAAGDYSFTVRGEAGSPLSHDTTATVHVLATPDSVSEVIDTIHALGCIDNLGVSAALQVKLSQAEAAIAAGDIQTAINILTALLHQLQAQAGKHIARECTDENDVTFDPVEVLIDNITALLASLGAQLQPTVVMGRVTNAGGADIADATVSILSGKTVVAAAKTDATGFYFFPRTNGLKPGALYVVKVTPPKGYKVSTPSSESFAWRATAIVLSNFALN